MAGFGLIEAAMRSSKDGHMATSANIEVFSGKMTLRNSLPLAVLTGALGATAVESGHFGRVRSVKGSCGRLVVSHQ
jgi:hypothetical protein